MKTDKVQNVRTGLEFARYYGDEFWEAVDVNSIEIRDELMVLQDYLTDFRNSLENLNSSIQIKIRQLSK